MLRSLFTLLSAASLACCLAATALALAALMGHSYSFGGTAGSNWGARAERKGFFVHWTTYQAPNAAAWDAIENASLLDLPGVHAERMHLVASATGSTPRTLVRWMTATQVQFWVLIVFFALLPAGHFAWRARRDRRKRLLERKAG